MTHSASIGARASSSFATQVKGFVLANGLTVLVQSVPGSGAVSIVGKLKAGDAFAGGYSLVPALVAHLLTCGSKMSSKLEIARASQRMGKLGFSTDTFHLGWSSTVTSSNFAAFMSLTAELLRQPLFADNEVELAKRLYGAAITSSLNDTGEMAHNVLAQKLYQSGPYAAKSFAQMAAELPEIDAMMLRQFYNSHVAPHGGVIAIVGDVDSEAAFSLCARLFGDWRGSNSQPIAIVDSPVPAKARFNVPVGKDDSLDVVIGRRSSVKWGNDDFCAARLANLILGGDTISSRLGKIVRVKKSLTYGISSGFDDFYFGGAPWTISLSTDVSKLESALSVVDEVVAEFLAAGVTEEEVVRQANRAAESFRVNLRTDLSVARSISELVSAGLAVGELDTYPQLIRAVTRDEVNAVIGKYFGLENAVTVVSGNVL